MPSTRTYIPPQEVAHAAAHGLALRKTFGRGGTSVGLARGRDLKNRRPVSEQTIRRMYSFFARHAVDKRSAFFGSEVKPSNGYIAWLLWGGDPGRAWVTEIRRELEAGKPPKRRKKFGYR
jgi:hypothetical protein